MVGDVIVVESITIGESAEGDRGVLTGRNVAAMIADGGGGYYYVYIALPEDETGWKNRRTRDERRMRIEGGDPRQFC